MTEPILNAADAVAALGALPVPVGPEPQGVDDRAKAPWGRDEDGRPILGPGAHWTDVPELVDREVAGIRARVDQAQSGHWYVASDVEAGLPPGTVRTRVDGYQRTVGQLTNVLPGDRELILHAHDDLSWCLEMLAKCRARIAVLESERHVTNEALDDAVQALRAGQDKPVEAPYVSRLLPPRGAVCARPGCGHQGVEHHHGDTKCWAHLPRTRDRFGAWSGITICGCSGFVAAPSVEESADKLTQLLAPTQALREGGAEAPHAAPCRWPSSPDCTCLEDGAE